MHGPCRILPRELSTTSSSVPDMMTARLPKQPLGPAAASPPRRPPGRRPGEGPARLHAAAERALQAATVLAAEAARAALDRGLLALRGEVHDVRSRLRRVEQATEDVARKLDAALRHMAGEGRDAAAEREREEERRRPRSRREELPGEELPGEELLAAEFRRLREGVAAFAEEVAGRSGALPRSLEVADGLLDPACWNRAGKQLRMYRVMAKVFHVLFRRILRPGLKAFGLQTFLRTTEHHAISAAESSLRALEREMESRRVPPEVINEWVKTTIAAIAPLRDVRQNVEGVTQEILEALDPLVTHGFIRSARQARQTIASLCEKAVNLKLRLRQRGGKYKVEVPSRDARRWGEAGFDEGTKAFPPTEWLRAVDHEAAPSTTEDKPAGLGDLRGVSVIAFGALTKVEDGIYDEHAEKTMLEPGWVVVKRSARPESMAPKPRSPVPDEMEVKRPARRAATTNARVSPRQMARIKALMGQDV
ncbi:hypothetical protein VTJ83DRAFT_5144 [Remersonia thermophila]|uniref:Uncharacterized protein n=1 Tax=Remersonia thermophila TaxID=72144 RepID=A0ABR4DC67_9PEZI